MSPIMMTGTLLVCVGLLHVGTGLAYLAGVGGMNAIDVLKGVRAGRGLDWLGVGLFAIALSCGPHHLDVGLHMLAGWHPAAAADLISILVAAPFGARWLHLRFERIAGWGPGDRTWSSSGRPHALLVVMAANAVVCVALMAGALFGAPLRWGQAWPQLYVLGCYLLIGWWLLTGQWQRHATNGTWSSAGLTLGAIFPTCATSHLVYSMALLGGVYPPHSHIYGANLYGVVAATFLCFVIADQRGQVQAMREMRAEQASLLADLRGRADD